MTPKMTPCKFANKAKPAPTQRRTNAHLTPSGLSVSRTRLTTRIWIYRAFGEIVQIAKIQHDSKKLKNFCLIIRKPQWGGCIFAA